MHSAPHTQPRDKALRAHWKTSRSPRGTWAGDLSPSASPHETTRRRVKDPAALAGPRTPVPRPRSPVLAPHDLVLVHDELVYIFQINLVSHGAAAPGPQPQISPRRYKRSSRRRETSFPTTQFPGRFPRQRRRRATAAVGRSNYS